MPKQQFKHAKTLARYHIRISAGPPLVFSRCSFEPLLVPPICSQDVQQRRISASVQRTKSQDQSMLYGVANTSFENFWTENTSFIQTPRTFTASFLPSLCTCLHARTFCRFVFPVLSVSWVTGVFSWEGASVVGVEGWVVVPCVSSCVSVCVSKLKAELDCISEAGRTFYPKL